MKRNKFSALTLTALVLVFSLILGACSIDDSIDTIQDKLDEINGLLEEIQDIGNNDRNDGEDDKEKPSRPESSESSESSEKPGFVSSEIPAWDPSDLNSYSLDEITELAKQEGHLESVGMPDSWVNWGEIWDAFGDIYGITQYDEDMSSIEELNTFASDSTKDIGDIGLAFTADAVEKELVQSYKTSYWDSVPNWAKHPDGLWMVAYAGATSFIYNGSICSDPMPTSWMDVRRGSYKITVGDVVGGSTGQGAVIATAYAFGGDLYNLQPGFDFWLQMAKEGRIDNRDLLLNRISSGDVELGVTWSYNAPGYRDSATGYNIQIGIPTDGAILVGYASVINKNCDNPFAAALAREYIFSDEGQLSLAKSGAIPTRTDLTIPQNIINYTFEPASYANAVGIGDPEAYAAACAEVSRWWSENILPLL